MLCVIIHIDLFRFSFLFLFSFPPFGICLADWPGLFYIIEPGCYFQLMLYYTFIGVLLRERERENSINIGPVFGFGRGEKKG